MMAIVILWIPREEFRDLSAMTYLWIVRCNFSIWTQLQIPSETVTSTQPSDRYEAFATFKQKSNLLLLFIVLTMTTGYG